MSSKAQEVALDRLLVDRFKKGDQSAFDEMVTRYWDRIYSMVNQLLRNTQDAEEVTQDAFIRAHRGLRQFRGDSSFFHLALPDRNQPCAQPVLVLVATQARQEHLLRSTHRPGGRHDPCRRYSSSRRNARRHHLNPGIVDRIGLAMEKLGTKHREILVLRNVKNMSYEEIAEVLGISVGTVKSRIARARENLREKLGEDFQAK